MLATQRAGPQSAVALRRPQRSSFCTHAVPALFSPDLVQTTFTAFNSILVIPWAAMIVAPQQQVRGYLAPPTCPHRSQACRSQPLPLNPYAAR